MNRSFFLKISSVLIIVLAFSQIHTLGSFIKHRGVTDTSKSDSNPFAIDFPQKKDLTDADYVIVQNLLSEINLDPLLHKLYVSNQNYTTFDDLKFRCCKALNQVLIDPDQGLFPVKHLEKIGKGGDMCFVSCASYSNSKYISFITAMPEALEKAGFNGYFFYRIGGYPNPTGKEIQYAGVPYAFKIFLMLEAEKLGFNKVIWIDSSLLPLRDPTPLFTHLEEKGSLILHFKNDDYNKRYIFPKTRELLQELTSIDVVSQRHISTQVFGLKMNAEKTKSFITQYYKFVSLGTPFCSCFPEEYVFSAIMEQSPSDWPSLPHFSILRYADREDPKEIDDIKNLGVFFYLRRH